MQIHFPQAEPKQIFDRDLVTFPAEVDGNSVKCFITLEAMLRFGRTYPNKMVETFKTHRPQIEELATQLADQGHVAENGELWIKAP